MVSDFGKPLSCSAHRDSDLLQNGRLFEEVSGHEAFTVRKITVLTSLSHKIHRDLDVAVNLCRALVCRLRLRVVATWDFSLWIKAVCSYFTTEIAIRLSALPNVLLVRRIYFREELSTQGLVQGGMSAVVLLLADSAIEDIPW